ncbi:MAG TPA: NAD(P)-dependent oxidoreductase [Candidatus Omnitrophota bacterium]|nr:NAD(P)-dependent oxidoreductase [Candidatus Omnitrophota bacterium]HRZ15833.1 NAD(P)-dependent oxidoreductase [Candidatus Omnitrophota bacterium]
MKILIVGGAGYLGGAVTDILLGSKHELRVYDLLLYEETYRKNVPFVYGDIRDTARLKEALRWADTVIWLAALVGDPACSLSEIFTRQVNTDSLRFLKDTFGGKIIFMSTCSVYGAAAGELDEKSSLNPLSSYARSKLQAEMILKDTDALIFRLGTLFGVSDAFSRIRFDLVVNTLVMRAVMHGRISIFGGQQYRPHLHVRDAAAAICACLDRKEKGIYNLAAENTTILELSRRLQKFFPRMSVEASDTMFQDNRNYRVSSAKATRELGFKPRFSLEDGIRELKAILEEGRVKNSFVSRFSNFLYLKPLISEYNSPLGKVIKQNI